MELIQTHGHKLYSDDIRAIIHAFHNGDAGPWLATYPTIALQQAAHQPVDMKNTPMAEARPPLSIVQPPYGGEQQPVNDIINCASSNMKPVVPVVQYQAPSPGGTQYPEPKRTALFVQGGSATPNGFYVDPRVTQSQQIVHQQHQLPPVVRVQPPHEQQQQWPGNAQTNFIVPPQPQLPQAKVLPVPLRRQNDQIAQHQQTQQEVTNAIQASQSAWSSMLL